MIAWRPMRVGAWLVVAAIAVLSSAYGLGYGLDTGTRYLAFRTASALFFLLLLGGAWGLMASGGSTDHAARRAGWSVPGATAAMLLLTSFLLLPNRALPLIAAVLAGLAALMRSEARRPLLGDLYLLLGWAVSLYLVIVTPIDRHSADMLPFIARAGQEYLAGHNPYYSDYSSIDGNSFLYLPVQWLAYVPLIAAGWDMRMLNLALALGVLLLVRSAVRGPAEGGGQAALVLYPLLVSYPTVQAVAVGQAWVYWFLVVALGLCLLHGRLFAAALVLGLALATRQTALIIAGSLAIYFAARLPLPRLILLGVLVVGVWLAAFVPFVGGDLGGLLELVYLDRPAFQTARAIAGGNPGDQISLAGFLFPDLATYYARYLQVLVALGFAVVIWRLRRRGPGVFMLSTGWFYLLAMGCNGYVHRYYYVAGFLLIGLGLLDSRAYPGHPETDRAAAQLPGLPGGGGP